MLYRVEKPDITILTHTFNPLMQTNGFKQLGDFAVVDAVSDNNLAGFSLKRSFKKLTSKPLKYITKKAASLSGKIATGGVTLITETGVLGKDAKKYGKKAEVIGSSAMVGAGTGFVTSGFNPAGLIAGGAAGLAKGIREGTKTRNPGDASKAFYQSAAWGAGAGAAVGATKAVINARQAASAKSSNIAQFAGKSGYVPGAKAAGSSFLTKALVTTAVAQNLLPQAAQPPQDGGYIPGFEPGEGGGGGGGGDTNITVQIPGSDGGYVPGGGGYGGGGADATVPFGEGQTGFAGGMSPMTKVALASAGILLLMKVGKKRAA